MTINDEDNGTFTKDRFKRLDKIVENMIGKEERLQEKSYSGEEKQSGRIMTGLKDYDLRLGGFAPGTLNIIAGRPAMGKTTLMIDIAVNAATDQKKPVYIFTLDNSHDFIAKTIISKITGNTGDIMLRCGDAPSDETREQYKECLIKIKKETDILPAYVFDKPNTSLTEIKEMVSAEVKDGIVFIDYLQLILLDIEDGCNDRGSLETNLIVLKELKALAKATGVAIVVLSQIMRVESRMNKRPNLNDFGVSYKAVIKYADTVTFIYRDGYYDSQNRSDTAELLIWKKRGDSEVAKVRFNMKKVSFENIVYNKNIDCIKKMVADHYGISMDDLLTRKKNPKYRIPRQVALYLCRQLTEANANEIGDAFGLDHSAVLMASKEVKNELEKNEYYRSEVVLLADSIMRKISDRED